MLVSVTELINWAISRNWKYLLLWLSFWLVITIFIESCSQKPVPAPTSKTNPNKPGWVNGKNKDNSKWYGVGSVTIGESIDPKILAIESIQKQVHSQIKKSIKFEFDINESVLESICAQALESRIQLIDRLIEEEDSYDDGTKRYILLGLNKNHYSEKLKKKLDDLDIQEILSQVQGPPDKGNFLLLAKAITKMVDFADIIVDRNLQTSKDHNRIFNKIRSILTDYNDRVFFNFYPDYLNSIPISNDQKEVSIRVIDAENQKKIDSIYVSIDHGTEHPAETWVSDSSKDYSLLLPNVLSRSAYVLDLSIDYQKMIGQNYLALLSIEPKQYRLTVIPKNIKVYYSESIATLGTGLNYSSVYDSIKNCFGNNYSAIFVQDINDSDVLMNIEVSTKENMRRQNRKQPFKSKTFFILSLTNRETGNNIFSNVIVETEAVDYDFVERASIKSLRDLANKASQIMCK